METLRRFRLLAVRISVAVTFVAAIVAYRFDAVVAKALLMGGVAGTLVFWVTAVRLEKLATRGDRAVYSVPPTWRLLELAVYALVIMRAHYMAPDSVRGWLSAVVGLFIVRGAAVVLGLTGWDLKAEKK